LPTKKKSTKGDDEKKKVVKKSVKKILKKETTVSKKTVAVSKSSNKIKKSAKKDVADKKLEKEVNKDDVVLGNLNERPVDSADLYDEIISQEIEREIVQKQRKRTAGRGDAGSKKDFRKNIVTVKKGPITDRPVSIGEVITVKEFSEKTGIGAVKIIGELMKNGVLANINQQIDFDTAQIIAEDSGVTLKKVLSEASAEDIFKGDLNSILKEDTENLVERPPIVVVMGHVDHGKTSILDVIRESNVVSGESGGITQHIGAYQVVKNDKKITFLDTPGHEAFTAMRARGAKVTDIAILVVAADDGVKPQTVEAISHAKDANIPIIVAINKIDKEGADIDRVKGELGEYDLLPEDWGGSTIMVPVSAKTGKNIDQLLEMVLLVADMANLKANPDRNAVGTVIESNLSKNLGPVVTVIVNTGTLHVMDNIFAGTTYGRVKVMKDYKGKRVDTAGPSTPVLLAGLSATPQSGDIFQVVSGEKVAREKAQHVQLLKDKNMLMRRGVGEIMTQIGAGHLKHLKIVLKADTKGSLEAIKQSLAEIKNDDVSASVILGGVGDVSESDVMMAAAAGGVVIAFNINLNSNVKSFSERENVEIMQYKIIYKLLDDVRKIMTGMLEPEVIETVLGRAELRQIFLRKKKEMIIGCKVVKGKIEKTKVRVFRKDKMVGEGIINSLKNIDKSVHSIDEGHDCGILYSGFLPLEEGDVLESYKMEKRIRTL